MKAGKREGTEPLLERGPGDSRCVVGAAVDVRVVPGHGDDLVTEVKHVADSYEIVGYVVGWEMNGLEVGEETLEVLVSGAAVNFIARHGRTLRGVNVQDGRLWRGRSWLYWGLKLRPGASHGVFQLLRGGRARLTVVLIARSAARIAARAKIHGGGRWSAKKLTKS